MTEFTPHEAPATDIQALPVMHPGRPVGRDDVLKEIYNHLQDRQAVLVQGADGLGKTALTAALAAAYTQQSGGVLWFSVGSQPLPALLVQVARGLGLPSVTTTEQPVANLATVADTLATRQPFIVLDDIEDALAPAQFVRQAAPNLPMILLSKEPLEGPWQSIALEGLADLDAVVLFKQKAGLQGNDHDIDIYGITKLLNYMPLPIVIAARGMVAAKQDPGTYLQNLKQVSNTVGDPVTAAIALSYRSLNNALQGLMLMLGATFRGEASVDFLSAVSNVPAQSLEQATTILSQLYLVERFMRQGKPYYRMHPLVYSFTQNALRGKNQLPALQKKVIEATLAYASQNAAADNIQPVMLAKEMANVVATAQWAAQNGNRDIANHLVSTLTQAGDFVQEYGYVYELLNLRHLGSGQTSAFPAYEPEVAFGTQTMRAADPDDDYYDDDIDDYDAEYERDASAWEVVDDDEAMLDEPDFDDLAIEEGMSSAALSTDSLQSIDPEQLRAALAQARQQGDLARQIQIMKALGKVLVNQGKETEAIANYNELLEAHESQDDAEGTLEILNMLAALLARTGNSQAAVMHATRGLQLADILEDETIRQQLFMTLGDARQELGETAAAVDSFAKGLEIARQTDDSQNEAIALYKLGYAHLDDGDTDSAIHSLEQALDLFKTQNKRDYEGRVLGGLGSAYSELERWTEAIGYYQSALHTSRDVNDREDEALQLSNLGQAQVEAGKLPDALLSYRQALHLAFESGQREDIVSAVVDLVRLMLRSKRLLSICDLLLQEAIALEPDDRDVKQLTADVQAKIREANAAGIEQAPVNGTARQYAANAYALTSE